MDNALLYHWLLENGGPILRWRLETELGLEPSHSRRERLGRELLAAPPVQEWLARLSLEGFDAPLDGLDAESLRQLGNRVHGSKPACLENVFGKLAEFGLRAGMAELDRRALPLMRIFACRPDGQTDAVYRNAWEKLVKSVFAWGLLRLGYPPDGAMIAFIQEHLRDCYKIAHARIYDLYEDEAGLAGLPKAWAGKPILKQEVMAGFWLPYIHDLYLFANLPEALLDTETQERIAALLAYILDPRFQALPDGYGYAWIKERHTCYGWGWSPHLPGFHGLDALPDQGVTPFLSRLELLARIPAGQKSHWVQSGLRHLKKFKTPQGTYCFPPGYLHESEGYYVSGYGMGLGENRRKPAALEIESTFRMLKIARLAQCEI